MTLGAIGLGERYEPGRLIGSGGMADVYVAVDRTLERQVAVKVLRNPADEVHRGRFVSEAGTLARLSHPGLVAVLDGGLVEESPYLVMELVEGPTLAQVVQRGPLDPERVRDLGVQLASALAYAHAQGVVHRDLKPGNILLGPGPRVRLADFGIARLVDALEEHTRVGETIGSPAYLAPEQVNGDPVTPAIDVYALGLVLLEALTGRRAYHGSPVEAAIARLRVAPAMPTSLPRPWRDLLARMTSRAPVDRPTAAQVVRALETLAPARAPVVPVPPAVEPAPTRSFAAPVEQTAVLPLTPPPVAPDRPIWWPVWWPARWPAWVTATVLIVALGAALLAGLLAGRPGTPAARATEPQARPPAGAAGVAVAPPLARSFAIAGVSLRAPDPVVEPPKRKGHGPHEKGRGRGNRGD